jgi:hypothetical protein
VGLIDRLERVDIGALVVATRDGWTVWATKGASLPLGELHSSRGEPADVIRAARGWLDDRIAEDSEWSPVKIVLTAREVEAFSRDESLVALVEDGPAQNIFVVVAKDGPVEVTVEQLRRWERSPNVSVTATGGGLPVVHELFCDRGRSGGTIWTEVVIAFTPEELDEPASREMLDELLAEGPERDVYVVVVRQ